MASRKRTSPDKRINAILDKWKKPRAKSASFQDGVVTISGFIQEHSDKNSFPKQLRSYLPQIEAFHFENCQIEGNWLANLNWFNKATKYSFKFTKISGRSDALSHMTELTLDHMAGEQVVHLISQAKGDQLKKLHIEWVNITQELNALIAALAQLTDLTIKSVKTVGGFGPKQELASLDLEQITLDPDFIFWLKERRGLSSIRLSRIQLEEPLSGEVFTNAVRIVLDTCSFSKLEPCDCPNLKELTIHGLPIIDIPDGYIGHKLTKLSIQYTQISTIASISNLSQLEELHLGNNSQLQTLPNKMSCLTTLERLSFAGLTLPGGLPPWLSDAEALERLDLTGCSLGTLSSNIGNCLAQRFIIVENIPDDVSIKRIPDNENDAFVAVRGLSIADMDARLLTLSPKPKELLSYYYNQNRLTAHEIKVFVLGTNAALARRALESILSEPEIAELATSARGFRMMDLRPYDFKQIGRASRFDSDVSLHVYEMSDSPVHSLAHPLFFSESSLYVVVLNSSGGARIEQEMQYWLTLLESHCANGHIVFCLAKTEKAGPPLQGVAPPPCLRRTTWTSDFCRLDLTDDEEKDGELAPQELLETIVRGIGEVKTYHWQVPEQWIRIKKHLQSLFRGLDALNLARLQGIIEYYHSVEDKEKSSKRGTPQGVIQGIIRWLREIGAMECRDGPSALPDHVFASRWFASCLYGVLDYAQMLGGTVTSRRITERADDDDDEIIATSFSQRAELVFDSLLTAGLCLPFDLNTGIRQEDAYYFPMVAGMLASQKAMGGKAIQGDISAEIRNLMKMEPGKNAHYLVRCPIVTEGLLSSFITRAYDDIQRSSFGEQATILLGHDGLFAWTVTNGPLPDQTSLQLFIAGAIGSPGDIHIFMAAPDTGSGSSADNVSPQRRKLARLILDCLDKTLTSVIHSPEIRKKCRVFFEQRKDDEYFTIPLDEILDYYKSRREDYYCVQVETTLKVYKLYEAYAPEKNTD
ncbi:MAG: Leucine Rich Repeat (LRR)-containing protein [Solidesulfovibrio magneticus str. Maddingley MBC34]|uniref:Leucine Rich Repeat (LRR)-containing protein n=1 Tax=Solidesulfovibrio magneticus str. Maddingley MBC34 TaxID=1206767 RepID=K6FMY9_9BACT|nr:MAG: Leucine Rich Repeat (LRR)-containing protein [Solidesulfovibrio magneticus str. Maddingley MBC34]